MNNLVIPIFIPHLGCPHTCAFCNQKKIAGKYQIPTRAYIEETVELYTKTRKGEETFIEIAFFGGSFTGINEDLQEELLKTAYHLKKTGKIHDIRLSTRPDYINPTVMARLDKYEVGTVELGVQSLDLEVLEKSQRGHSDQEVLDGVNLLRKHHKKVGIQLMPGLPGDNYKKIINTTLKVIEMKPDFVRIYPTVIIKDTLLEEWYHQDYYHPLSLEDAVEISAQMVMLFEKEDILVIRIGLQAQENLAIGQDLIGGPHHPALGEMVKSRVFRKQMAHLLFKKNTTPLKDQFIMYCNPRDISQVKGQNKDNIKYFQDKYDLKITISAQPSLSLGFLAFVQEDSNQYLWVSRREFLDNYRS